MSEPGLLVTAPERREFRAEAWLPLLQEALALDGRFTFLLRGDSMRPTLPNVCDIDVIPPAPPPRVGQLIVFAVGDTLVAHRLVDRRNGLLIAQGDNRRGPDAPLKPQQVLGVVDAARLDRERIWPGHGEWFRSGFWVARYHVLRPPRWAVLTVRRWFRRRPRPPLARRR